MQEILFLLLPIAFYAGWRNARKQNDKDQQQSIEPPNNFVQGVNFLLNEKPDQALDIFLNYPHVDEHTADTLLSLGNMFRDQGEVNRALRVHQHLVARSDLSKQQRLQAMTALGKDFFAAGLLDRAEQVFKEILTIDANYQAIHEPLRHIYEKLHEWEKAIQITQQSKLEKNEKNRLVAHYLCEQVRSSLDEKQLFEAGEKLKEALKQNPESARVKVLQGELSFLSNEQERALTYYQQAIEMDGRLLEMLSDRLLQRCQNQNDREQLFQFVEKIYNKQQDPQMLSALLKVAQQSDQLDQVQSILLAALQKQLLSLGTLSRAAHILGHLEGVDSHTALLSESIQRTATAQPEFQCEQCGYKMHDFLWRCPACHRWDSVSNP